MPAVLTFWQFPEEEPALLDLLQQTGKILAVPGQWVKNQKVLAPQPIRSLVKKNDPNDVFFGLEPYALTAFIEAKELEEELFYAVSLADSCLVGYSRGKFRSEKKLGFSNLYAYYTNSQKQEKDPDFVKWVKKIFRDLRAATTPWDPVKKYRVTARVLKAIEQEGLEIVP
jgi:hypothetical protein